MPRYEIHSEDEGGARCVEEIIAENWLDALSRSLSAQGASPLQAAHSLDFGEGGAVSVLEPGGRRFYVQPAQLLQEGPPNHAQLPWVEAPMRWAVTPSAPPMFPWVGAQEEGRRLLSRLLTEMGNEGALLLLDPITARLRLIASVGRQARARSLNAEQEARCLDATQAHHLMSPALSGDGSLNAGSVLCAPIQAEGGMITLGVIELRALRDMAFTPAHERRLMEVARVFGEALWSAAQGL